MAVMDGLPPARAASDDDMLTLSQGGVVRRVSRGQLLAGVQAELALPQGALLGRASAGTGAPEAIRLGAGLVLADGTLSAPGTMAGAGLPDGVAPGVFDRVAVRQAGREVALPFGTFMAGLARVPEVDGSGLLVSVPDGTARTLAAAVAEWATLEAFGAVGDGVTDDGAALRAALASGRPVRLSARTYAVGAVTIERNAVLLGVAGASALCRLPGAGDWIVATAAVRVEGVAFDARGIGGDALVLAAGCTRSELRDCVVRNAGGSGLVIRAGGEHRLQGCAALDGGAHGMVLPASGARVTGCTSSGNAGDGLRVAGDGHGVTWISDTACRGNARGVVVQGGQLAVLSRVVCEANGVAGIVVAGALAWATECVVMAAGQPACGIAAGEAAAGSRIAGCLVRGAFAVGIDVSASGGCEVLGNQVAGATVGVDGSGARGLRVSRNLVTGCDWGVLVRVVARGQATGGVAIEDNRIVVASARGAGVWLVDGAVGVRVERNAFEGTGSATAAQALWAHTDAVLVAGNRWNGMARHVCETAMVGGRDAVVFPDIADVVSVVCRPAVVQSMLGLHQRDVLGQVTFVQVSAGGTGYGEARVVLHGTGVGAAAEAELAGGRVIGVRMTAPGSGYGTIGFVAVTIEGDGRGAAAVGHVGLPVPDERRLRVACSAPVRFAVAGSSPRQENWTGFDMTVPGGGEAGFVGGFGGWRATDVPLAEYVSPDGDGGMTLRSAGGAVTLRPTAGRVMVAADDEPVGFAMCVGRGSPVGTVSAPPGSEYRNLDGGSGSTLWVKQMGEDSAGWIAIA